MIDIDRLLVAASNVPRDRAAVPSTFSTTIEILVSSRGNLRVLGCGDH